MQSQNQRILKHLKSGKKITAIEALKLFGCFRLARVMNDLKNQGISFNKRMIKRNHKHFAEYSL